MSGKKSGFMLESEKKKKISLVSLLPPKKYKLSSVRGPPDTNPTPKRWSQVLALLPVYLLQICYGMNSGFPAILTPQLREDCSEFNITVDQESWIVSLDNILTPIICVLSGPIQQRWGPRSCLVLCCFPYFISWLLAALAANHYILYASRVLVGVSHALICTTVYTIEVSSVEMRGTYSVLESVLRCTGCVLVYALGLFYRWKTIAYIGLVIPVLALISCILSPESPIYLVSKQQHKKAELSLKRLYGSEFKSRQEVLLLSESLNKIQRKRRSKCEYLQNIRKHPDVYRPFLILIILSVVQQFSGVTVIRAYVVKIFHEVFRANNTENIGNMTINCEDINVEGGPNKTSGLAYMSAITIGLFRLAASLTLARLLLQFRRRNMYLLSLTLSILCLLTFSLFSFLAQDSFNPIFR
ncbi:facilitated trehalose transporter Tret1 [Eurytemora carolleeae]|uniref:facilitated trehalose transporter Tret1 n=1 Tax=Eurytemora carolleeae TaxID=1294199 RepID=UPI000C759A53|nr:facilitated trehalose transporter Tret1 [Eurytemora carolleeae]|eukprot:XP_023343548.1 facilitated trehalose transporter Tret1-like [Eurytemora affinis]